MLQSIHRAGRGLHRQSWVPIMEMWIENTDVLWYAERTSAIFAWCAQQDVSFRCLTRLENYDERLRRHVGTESYVRLGRR